jgi:excisionase family DNA binding protein
MSRAVASALPNRSTIEVDERELLDRVLRRDQAAWVQFVRRFDPPLRALLAGELGDAQVDDVLGDLWLRLVDSDMRRLRAFAESRPGPLSAWLAMQATQVAFDHAQQEQAEPETVALEDAPQIADTRRAPAPASRMMKVEEVAERWDLNVKTVYWMIQRGELVSRRCGRVLRVPRAVVESFERASCKWEKDLP